MTPTTLESPPADPPSAAPGPPLEGRRRRVLPLGLRLLFELVVVFAGVYAASALGAYQERREDDARRRQVQRALVEEIGAVTENTRRIQAQLAVQTARFDSLVAAGVRVPLMPVTDPTRPQTHMWEASLQSGVLDLFDVGTVYRLSAFYNGLGFGLAHLEQMQRLSESLLLPRMGEDPAAFYRADRNELRPEFQWWRNGMANIGRAAGEVTVMGDSLLAELAADTAAAR